MLVVDDVLKKWLLVMLIAMIQRMGAPEMIDNSNDNCNHTDVNIINCVDDSDVNNNWDGA